MKLNNVLLNDQCVIEEVKKKIKTFLRKVMLLYDLSSLLDI